MIGKRHWNYIRRFRTFIANTDVIASDAHFWTLVAEIRLVTDPLIKMTSKLHLEVLHFMIFVVTYEEMDLFVTGLHKIVTRLLAMQPLTWFEKPIAAVHVISRLETMRRGALQLLTLFVHPEEYHTVSEEGQKLYDNLLVKIDGSLDAIEAVIFKIMDHFQEELVENDTDERLMMFLARAKDNQPVRKVTLKSFVANEASPQLVQKVLSPEIFTWYEEVLREDDGCTSCGHSIEREYPADCVTTASCEHPYCSRCIARLERPIDSLCKVVLCEKEMKFYTSMQTVQDFHEYKRKAEIEERQRAEREADEVQRLST